MIGRVLIYPVGAKEPVMQRDLASAGSFGLSARIPDGMRAMAVKTNEVSSVAGFIFPGSHVDVLGTFRMEGNNSTISRTVLQNVQVLSTGTKTAPYPNGKPENVTVVTLLVTPEQSTKLVLAQNQGTIQISLRNGADSVNPEVASVDLADLAGTPKTVAKPSLCGYESADSDQTDSSPAVHGGNGDGRQSVGSKFLRIQIRKESKQLGLRGF